MGYIDRGSPAEHRGKSTNYQPVGEVLGDAVYEKPGIIKKAIGVSEEISEITIAGACKEALVRAWEISVDHYRNNQQAGEAQGTLTLVGEKTIQASQPGWNQGDTMQILLDTSTSRQVPYVIVGRYHNHPPVPEHYYDGFSIEDFTDILFQDTSEPIPPVMELMIHGDGQRAEMLLRTENTPRLNMTERGQVTEEGIASTAQKMALYSMASQDEAILSDIQKALLSQPENQEIIAAMKSLIKQSLGMLRGSLPDRDAAMRIISNAATELTIDEMSHKYHVLHGLSDLHDIEHIHIARPRSLRR